MISKLETMTFQELRIFREVIRSGGITPAADKLGAAKSVVSKQLTKLEEKLNVRLLARSSRRVTLTREGEKLLPRIELLLAEGERLLEDAQEGSVKPSGMVRVSASPEFGSLMARHFLPQVVEKYPDVAISMKFRYGFEDLQDPSTDLAFRIGEVHDDRLVAKPLGEFRRMLVASPQFAKQHPVKDPPDLESVSCVTFSGDSTSTTWTLQHIQQSSRIEHVKVSGRISILSFSALLGAVEGGAGIGNVPTFVARNAVAQGRILYCLPEWASMPLPVFIVHRFGAERIGRVRAIIEEARSIVPGILTDERITGRCWTDSGDLPGPRIEEAVAKTEEQPSP